MKSAPLLAAVVVAAIPLVSVAQVQQSHSWLCIASQSTGFGYDKTRHSWDATRFAAVDKFIVRRVTKDTVAEFDGGSRIPLSSAWAIWRFGNDKIPFAECRNDFGENGMLFCEGENEVQFQFSAKTGRFVAGTVYGYVSGAVSAPAAFGSPAIDWPEGSNTPFIEIGTCSTI